MSKTVPPVLRIILVLLGLSCAAFAWSADKLFTLKEVTGSAWGPSVVHYQATFDRPIADETTTLLDPQGNVLPFQLSDVTRNGGRITSATVSFLAALAPHETRIYKLRQQSRPPSPPTPVTVTTRPNEIELANENIRVKLAPLTNHHFSPALPAAQVAAPLRGFRLADGKWAGASAWQSSRLVSAFSAELIAEGPVFAEAVYTYHFVPSGVYTMTVRVEADAPMVFIDEDFTPGEAGERDTHLTLSLSQGWLPQVVCWRAIGTQQRGAAFDRQQARVIARGWKLTAPPPTQPNYFELALPAPGDPLLPSAPAERVWYAKAGTDYLAVGRESTDGKSLAATAGFLQLHAGRWRRADDFPVRLRVTPDGRTDLELPITPAGATTGAETPGHRVWALTLGSMNDCDEINRLRRQHGVIGLDRYKDWTLEWTDAQGTPTHPRLFTTPEQARALRASVDTHPCKALLKQLYAVNPEEGNGAQSVAQTLLRLDAVIFSRLRSAPAPAGAGNELAGLDIATRADDALGWAWLPADQRATLRAQLAATCYLLADADSTTDTEFSLDRQVLLPSIATLLPTHPCARAWLEQAAWDWQAQWNTLAPGGELDWRILTDGRARLLMYGAVPLLRAGLAKETITRALLKLAEAQLALTGAPGSTRGILGGADPQLAPVLAYLLGAYSPDPLGNALMWQWEQCGKPHDMHGLEQSYGLLLHPEILPSAPKEIPDTAIPGIGLALHRRVDTPREEGLFIMGGTSARDSGALTFAAGGEMLCQVQLQGENALPFTTTLIEQASPHGMTYLHGTRHGPVATDDWDCQWLWIDNSASGRTSLLAGWESPRETAQTPAVWGCRLRLGGAGVSVERNALRVTTPRNHQFDVLFVNPAEITPRLRQVEGDLGAYLNLPAGAGCAYVLYPHLPGEPAPRVTSPSAGVLKITTDEETDWLFLSAREPITFHNDQVTFTGRAGAVRIFRATAQLILAAGEGCVGFREQIEQANGPFEKTVPRKDNL